MTMFPQFDYFTYYRVRNLKRKERERRFASLNPACYAAFTTVDREIIQEPIEELVQKVQNHTLSAVGVLRTYAKVAIRAQEKTNCITELLLPEAETWAQSEVNIKGPLAGVPVSLKDSVHVRGFDTTLGYARYAGQPREEDGPMVKLLKDAGAVPYAKTALPVTLLSFESDSGLWGPCLNPHNPKYSPGGSSGGEGALLALGGRIAVGSDVAGSVRIPAAWSGCYSLRCSTGRWPKVGTNSSMPGQEGIGAVFSPMARTLNDLTYFTRSLITMRPWNYDHSVHPIPWRVAEERDAREKHLRIGLMNSDGVVPPTPAIERALSITVAALMAAGHVVETVNPPEQADPFTGLDLAAQLLNSDGCTTVNEPFHSFEPSDPAASQLTRIASLPRPIRYLYYLYLRYLRGEIRLAILIRNFGPKSSEEHWKLVSRREAFRATWHAWWDAKPQQYDFILCPVHSSPALPHKSMQNAVTSCGYTFIWNLLDYTAGVVPVSRVDGLTDALNAPFKTILKTYGCDDAISRGVWRHYNAEHMAGLPVAVQIVGRRLQEERVLGYMAIVETALEDHKETGAGKYNLIQPE
ncbi:acetamidase [Lipomyces kononenkoae]|uniref:Acetamidase n=1 Tax=Lipomyces kononenkoae TaxID=34357 RepID=A0ACC3SQT6_LIPKO